MQELRDNRDNLAFYDKLSKNQKNITLGDIISQYDAKVSSDGKFNNRIINLILQSSLENPDITIKRLNESEPIVVLNTYKANDPIYDYYKLNNS